MLFRESLPRQEREKLLREERERMALEMERLRGAVEETRRDAALAVHKLEQGGSRFKVGGPVFRPSSGLPA